MLTSIHSVFLLMCLLPLFLHSESQYLDSAASLGGAKVGIYSRSGIFDDSDSAASLGGAPVGVYRRQQYLQPRYILRPVQRVFVKPIRPVKQPYKPAYTKRPQSNRRVVYPASSVKPYNRISVPRGTRPPPGGVQGRVAGLLGGLLG